MKNNTHNSTKRASINKSRKNKTHKNKIRKVNGVKPNNNHIVKYMLQMLITVKLYHWNTLSFSVHKATDDLYGELNTLIDQFVEILLGKADNINKKNKHNVLDIKSVNTKIYMDNGGFKKEIDAYKNFMIGLSSVFNHRENSDLLNVRDEILATLNKMSYLLTLK
jgi:DNA-binding ferritin-like protein